MAHCVCVCVCVRLTIDNMQSTLDNNGGEAKPEDQVKEKRHIEEKKAVYDNWFEKQLE